LPFPLKAHGAVGLDAGCAGSCAPVRVGRSVCTAFSAAHKYVHAAARHANGHAAAHANGLGPHRVSNTLNVSFPGADSDSLVAALDLEGVAVATGAACAAGSTEPSHVLLAMGLSPDLSSSAIRISLGFGTRSAEVDRFLSVLPGVVERVRGAA